MSVEYQSFAYIINDSMVCLNYNKYVSYKMAFWDVSIVIFNGANIFLFNVRALELQAYVWSNTVH